RDQALRLVLLTGADRDGQRQPLAVADQVHLGPEAALAPPQGMVRRFAGGPFFFSAPAAALWARTTVPSTKNRFQPMRPSAWRRTCSASRIRSQSPSRVQRRKRP